MAEQNFQQTVRMADRGYVLVHCEVASGGTMRELEESDAVRPLSRRMAQLILDRATTLGPRRRGR